MGPDTENNNNWVKKNRQDTVNAIQGAAHYRGVCLIDVRFTFQPGGSVLLARGVNVGDLKPEQVAMITEWRVSDIQLSAADSYTTVGKTEALLNHLRERRDTPLPGGTIRVSESNLKHSRELYEDPITLLTSTPTQAVHKPIAESKYPHYFKDVRHLNYVDIYRLLDLFEITDQPIAHAIKKLMVAGARGAKDQDQDISEAIDCLLRRQAMRKEDTRKNKPEV